MIEHASQAVAYLDANVFIFFYEGDAAISERAKNLFDALRKHPGAGVTSELTLAEVLAESERPRNAMLKRAYLDLIVWSKFIDLVPIGREILYDSVDLRANHKRAHVESWTCQMLFTSQLQLLRNVDSSYRRTTRLKLRPR